MSGTSWWACHEQFLAACRQPPYAPEGGDAGARLRDAGRRRWPCPRRPTAGLLKPLPMDRDYLLLKRAAPSRPSGEWNDDDHDVVASGEVVGRIFKANAAPVGSPWMWTLAFGHHEDRTPTHGYAATREAAIAASRKAGGGNCRTARHPSGENCVARSTKTTNFGKQLSSVLRACPPRPCTDSRSHP